MKLKVPATAPLTPPETGASIMDKPNASASLETFLAVSGAIVEQSIIKVEGSIDSSSFSSRYKDSTC